MFLEKRYFLEHMMDEHETTLREQARQNYVGSILDLDIARSKLPFQSVTGVANRIAELKSSPNAQNLAASESLESYLTQLKLDARILLAKSKAEIDSAVADGASATRVFAPYDGRPDRIDDFNALDVHAIFGNAETVTALREADVKMCGRRHGRIQTGPLGRAIVTGNLDAAEALVHGSSYALSNLVYYCADRDPERVGKLFDKILSQTSAESLNQGGCAVDDYSFDRSVSSFPLNATVITGNIEAARKLLEAGADPNICRALHALADAKQSTDIGAMAKLLIEHGADFNASVKSRTDGYPSRFIATPLMNAVLHGNTPLKEVLTEMGAELGTAKSISGDGWSPMDEALSKRSIASVRMMKSLGIEPLFGTEAVGFKARTTGANPMKDRILRGALNEFSDRLSGLKGHGSSTEFREIDQGHDHNDILLNVHARTSHLIEALGMTKSLHISFAEFLKAVEKKHPDLAFDHSAASRTETLKDRAPADVVAR